MGYVPLPPMARNAHQALAWYGPKWQRDLKGRRSRWAWKRRRAHDACLALIKAREAIVGYRADPWVLRPPPKPRDLYPAQPAPDYEQ